ncbi:hypothetical protein G3A49_13585 [Haloferax volcanii]|uniref:Restriction endonuclease n=2 Tax=Haloferax TaxID=2251 RepID=A0A6C0UXH9_HALVO|nr:hypothetical protein [Haloferax alexandrinus]QIB79101.1 hypothetical protein G3A49_13585 [Haloferax alexandrinus]
MSSRALPNRVVIREQNKKTIEDCPPEIGKQLQRAAFDKIAANEFEKTRTTRDGEDSRKVVTATIEGDSLTISVEDIIGIVNLTPTSKLQINPKIGWEDILEMFLAIQRRNRSLQYHGIPIDDFLSEDIEIDDIFVVIAINYLNSLRPIHRNGFIRRFENREYDAVTGRGRIDVEESLLNKARGIQKHRFVEKDIDYSTPSNSLIYTAGKQLLRLFQDASSDHSHEQYFQIFSSLREEVRNLEELGVSTSEIDLTRMKQTHIADLPRQRRYYEDAVKTSKTIISSTTGQSLESGTENLTIDFILDMDQVFETFTQLTLEQEAKRLNRLELSNIEGDVTVEEEPTLQVYSDDTVATYRPDHVLKETGNVVAVLDSKYFSEHLDPSQRKAVRTRMLSYAFLLDTTEMAFVAPFGDSLSRNLELRDGKVSLVRPGEEFSIPRFREAVRAYLESHFHIVRPIEDLRDEIDPPIAHAEISFVNLDSLENYDQLNMDEAQKSLFASKIRKSVIQESDEVARFDNLSRSNRHDLLNHIKDGMVIGSNYNFTIPTFVESISGELLEGADDDWEGEAIKYINVKVEKGEIKDFSEPQFIQLKW